MPITAAALANTRGQVLKIRRAKDGFFKTTIDTALQGTYTAEKAAMDHAAAMAHAGAMAHATVVAARGPTWKRFNPIPVDLENHGTNLHITYNPAGQCAYLPYMYDPPGATWTLLDGFTLFVTGPFSGCDFVTMTDAANHTLAAHIAGKKNEPAVKAMNQNTVTSQNPSFHYTRRDVRFLWREEGREKGLTGVVVGALFNGLWHFLYTRPGRVFSEGHVYRITHHGLAG